MKNRIDLNARHSVAVLIALMARAAFALFLMSGFAQSVSAQTHTLTASPDSAAVGRELYVCWTAPAGSSATDWITLNPVGSTNYGYYTYVYTNGAESGCASFPAPAVGLWEFRYLLSNTYTDATTSNEVEIVDPMGAYSVSPIPTEAIAGNTFYACWNAPPGSSVADAIGMFDAQLPPSGALATQPTMGSPSGCTSFLAPSPGAYEVRYLSGGTLDVAEGLLTTIPAQGVYTLTASPDSAAVGRELYVCWTAPAGSSATDWITLNPVGSTNYGYYTYVYTNGAESGCASFPAPAVGLWEFRYLLSNTYTDATTSNEVEIVDPMGAYSVSPIPTEAIAGNTIYACWTAPAGSSPADAIGLFDTQLPPAGPLSAQGTCGALNGCAAFVAPASGTYEVRYLYDGTLDVSKGIVSTIASPGSYSLSVSPGQVPVGDTFDVCWTAPAGSSPTDWITLNPAGSTNYGYYTYVYTNGAESGCASFPAPAVGLWEFRYLLSNTYTDATTSNEVEIGSHSYMHSYEWQFTVTEDPQNHPDFSVDQTVSVFSFVPRGAVDQQPQDPTTGEFQAGYARLKDVGSAWAFGNPRPTLTIHDEFAMADGVRLDATTGQRSIAISCVTDSTLYNDDGLKMQGMPVPAIDCPGSSNGVTIDDSIESAVVDGQLECSRYVPEPSFPISIGVAAIALLGQAIRRQSIAGGGRCWSQRKRV